MTRYGQGKNHWVERSTETVQIEKQKKTEWTTTTMTEYSRTLKMWNIHNLNTHGEIM